MPAIEPEPSRWAVDVQISWLATWVAQGDFLCNWVLTHGLREQVITFLPYRSSHAVMSEAIKDHLGSLTP